MSCVPLVFLALMAISSALDCGEYGRVLQCPCTRTCANPEGPHFCPCIEGCSCLRGYLLDEITGKCVLPEQCTLKVETPIYPPNNLETKCGENSEFVECPCNKTCENPDGPSSCDCTPGCTCATGFLFDEKTKKCVKKYECTQYNVKIELQCQVNSHIEKCPCKKTCEKPHGPLDCPCIEGCECDSGFLLDEKYDTCVKSSNCSKKSGDGFFSSIFQVFDDIEDTFFGDDIARIKASQKDTTISTTTSTTTTTTTQKPTETIPKQDNQNFDFVFPDLFDNFTNNNNKTANLSNASTDKTTNSSGDLLIIIGETPMFNNCEVNSHYQPCYCERTCKRPQKHYKCPCTDSCKCNRGFYRNEVTNKCVRFEHCPQYDNVVVKRSFLSWCFSPDEPIHIVFSLLFCAILISLILSLCTMKHRRNTTMMHDKVYVQQTQKI